MKSNKLIFLFLLMGFIACDQEISKIDVGNKVYNPKIETARDVETIYSSEGSVKVKVTAPLLITHSDAKEPTTEFSEGLKVAFYNANLQERSRLTAKYAIRYEKTGKVFIRDSVRIINPNDELIESDELIWDEKKQEITSDKKVKITTADEQITAYGFWANQDFSVYELDSVSGIVKVASKEIE